MQSTNVRAATRSDEQALVDTIILAFATDPFLRWTWPDPHAYLTNMPTFISAYAGEAFSKNGALCTSDRAGAALWLPPGAQSDVEALSKLAERTIALETQGDLGAVLEQMGSYHPEREHWYLQMIGVDPARQGKGYGGALMKHALAACRSAGLQAYLESSNVQNIPFYEALGFRVLGIIQVGTSPTITPMLWQPN